MNKMEKIRGMLCAELDEIADKGELSAGDLQSIHMLTDTIKNIDKIEYLDGGYAEGMHVNHRMYDDGYSNARHYVRGHYSMDDGTDMMMHRIDEMMNNGKLSNVDKDALRRAKDILMK